MSQIVLSDYTKIFAKLNQLYLDKLKFIYL